MTQHIKPIRILLVEDNPGDIRLAQLVLEGAKFRNELIVKTDGQQALEYLTDDNEETPDLVLLDWNLPKLRGNDVLKAIKQSDDLRRIPVIVLTTSDSDQDVIAAYDNYANSYIKKPLSVEAFMQVVQSTGDFWISIVTLPGRTKLK